MSETRWARTLTRVGAAVALAACASPAVTPTPTPAPVTLADATVAENLDVYRNAGFLVAAGSIPFVGLVRFTATEYLDSTTVLVALSIPPRSLSFVRAGDRYAAYYAMRIDLMRGDAIVRSDRPTGEVRVASFSETTRGDEGVIFQRAMRVAPAAYTLRVTAQDSLGAGTGTATTSIVVPAMGEGVVGQLIPVFMSEPRRTRDAPLSIVANPRATARYGRDSVLEVYFESYGAAAPDTILVSARRSGRPSGPLFVDTLAIVRGSAVRGARVTMPIDQLDLGTIRVSAARLDGRELDSLTAVVSLGVDLPVTSVTELVEALRYFLGAADLERLRNASSATRPGQWAALVRRTDPNQATPDNEALLEYARRLRIADRLYTEGGRRGWQTDRGAVLAALGEPDVATAPQPTDSAGAPALLTWEYRRHRLFLVFSGAAGRWELTPESEAEFLALVTLIGPCVGCR